MSAYLLIFLSLCLPVNPSVFKPLCQGVRQYVSRIVCQYLCLSVFYIHPSGRLSICVFVNLLVCQSVSLFVCSSVCQTIFLSIMLSVSLSVCRSVCVFVYILFFNVYYMILLCVLLYCYFVLCSNMLR